MSEQNQAPQKPYTVIQQGRPVFTNFGTIADIKRRLKEIKEKRDSEGKKR